MLADGDPRLEAVGATKTSTSRSLQTGDDHDLPGGYSANLDSQDYIEGPKAFAERRKPNWRNR